MEAVFTVPGIWESNPYSLVFQLRDPSDTSIKQALTTLWNTPPLEGCYLRTDVEPAEQARLSPSDPDHPGPYCHGIATFPNGKRLAASSWYAAFTPSDCWIDLSIPMRALATIYPVGAYPLNVKSAPSAEPWLRAVNEWFKKIADAIYPSVRFSIAAIGILIDPSAVNRLLENGIPEVRWDGLLIPSDDRLIWYPPTTYEPPLTELERLL